VIAAERTGANNRYAQLTFACDLLCPFALNRFQAAAIELKQMVHVVFRFRACRPAETGRTCSGTSHTCRSRNKLEQIESDISAYLMTITAMNAAVGIATATVMWLTGVGDPILWGTIAFFLNFVQILGPLLGALLFLLAGALAADSLWLTFLPAALYLAIHLVEGETITPMLLARRFTLNPVLVIVSLVFWFWMWGIPGAILSVPMLAIAKIVCDRVRPLAAFGHFLEG